MAKAVVGSCVVFLLVVCLGCAGTQYGSHEYPVVLDTVPTHCSAWVIPYRDWLKKQKALTDTSDVIRAKFRSGFTPWTASLLPYRFVVLAMDSSRTFRWKEFTPSMDARVTVEFAPH